MHGACFSSLKVPLRSTKAPTICFLGKLYYVDVAWQQNTRHTLDTEKISGQNGWNTTWRPQLDQWAAGQTDAHPLRPLLIPHPLIPPLFCFSFLINVKKKKSSPILRFHWLTVTSPLSVASNWEFCEQQRPLAARGRTNALQTSGRMNYVTCWSLSITDIWNFYFCLLK